MSNILNRFSEEEQEVDLQADKYLTFVIDKQYYAFPIKDIIEIIEVQSITPVPEFPTYAKGIINLRGRIIPIIDVRLRFRKEEADYTERTCIIVVSILEKEVGFIVDTVDEVIDIDDSDISDPPSISTDRTNKYIIGVGKVKERIVLILDSNKMLNEKEIETLSSSC